MNARKRNSVLKSDAGLTLVEILLAAAILSICLLALLLIFVNVGFLNEANRNTIIAYNALQTKMEQVKALGYDSLCTSPSSGCNIVNNDTFTLTGFPSSRGQGRIEILYAYNTTADVKSVRAYACFQGRRLIGDSITNCRSSSVELKTMVTR